MWITRCFCYFWCKSDGGCWIATEKNIAYIRDILHIPKFHRAIVDGKKPANHLLSIKPCETSDILHINWCRISSINSRLVGAPKAKLWSPICGNVDRIAAFCTVPGASLGYSKHVLKIEGLAHFKEQPYDYNSKFTKQNSHMKRNNWASYIPDVIAYGCFFWRSKIYHHGWIRIFRLKISEISARQCLKEVRIFLLLVQKSGETAQAGSLSHYFRWVIYSPGGAQFPTNFVLKPFHLDVQYLRIDSPFKSPVC